jgi:hypothetical protein
MLVSVLDFLSYSCRAGKLIGIKMPTLNAVEIRFESSGKSGPGL